MNTAKPTPTPPKQPVKVESTFSKADAIKTAIMIGCTTLIIITNSISNTPTAIEKAWQYYAACEAIEESRKDSQKWANTAFEMAIEANNEAEFERAWKSYMNFTEFAERDSQLWQQLKKSRPSLSSKYQKELDKTVTEAAAKKEETLQTWKKLNQKTP